MIMTYQDLLNTARKNMAPKCRACPECNGVACRGEVPGVGGCGNGKGFTNSVEYLRQIGIEMDTICEDFVPDTSVCLLGQKLTLPLMISPIGGMNFNYNGYLTDYAYNEAILCGSEKEGILAFSGDTPDAGFFESSLPLIREGKGRLISTIKPWPNDYILEKAAKLKENGAEFFAIDIDSAGLPALWRNGKGGRHKSIGDIRSLIEESGMKLILKGIMTAKGAEKAKEAGAAAIIVSSHGGRHYQDAPATASVLPEIRSAVGKDYPVFVDGGIRSGADIFKVIALGADAAMIGRPYAAAVHGSVDRGVRIYTKKLRQEFSYTMSLTGCRSVREISIRSIRYLKHQ